MEKPEVSVQGTQGVLGLQKNDEQLSELISLIVAAQPYLFMPPEEGMEELRNYIELQNQPLLMKSWELTRPLQLWEIQETSLKLMARQTEKGERFVGISVPHNGVSKEIELPIKIWVEADEQGKKATLYLPSES